MVLKQAKARALAINSFYKKGYGDSLDILREDFSGEWPPRGLEITQPPTIPIIFQGYVALDATSAYVDNTESGFILHMNKTHMLERAFTNASQNIANTISHENIHILQKKLIRSGLSDPFGRGKNNNHVKKMLGDRATHHTQYLADVDEIQARLHEIVTNHYRQFREIPLNQRQFRALINGQDIKKGLRVASYQKKWSGDNPVSDLNCIFLSLRDDKKYEFYTKTLPLLYGGLLELYGDCEGSRRMGFDHNITLTDLFFIQARRIQNDRGENRPGDTTKLNATIAAMPKNQAADLLKRIFLNDAYIHPLSMNEMRLNSHNRDIVIGPLLQRGGFGDICAVEDIALLPYKITP